MPSNSPPDSSPESPDPFPESHGARQLPALQRAGAVLATWLLLTLSLPGIGRPGGFGHLAFVALVPWALAVRRPGRRAFLAEWGATLVGMTGVVYWLWYVVPAALFLIPLVGSFYMAGAGLLLRRLALRWPLAVAVPAAWTMGELVRGWIPVPASFLWHRLGHMAHDTAWLVGSARVTGSFGLTWVFAAFAGMVADLWLERRGERSPRRRPAVLAAGLAPLVLAIASGLVVPAPASEPGPRVLIVQPGIEQEVKSFGADPLRELFVAAVEQTHGGLAAMDGPPDLVLWGETSLPIDVFEEPVLEAISRGLRPAPWAGYSCDLDSARRRQFLEQVLVPGVLFPGATAAARALSAIDLPREWLDRARAGEFHLPEGCAFAAGATEFVALEDNLRRRNSYYVWDAEGRRGPPAAKQNLVPGGETLLGAHRLPGVLDIMYAVGGYVPDFIPAEEPAALSFTDRTGREWNFGVAICFDNVFDDPFLVPLRRGPVDFTVVASNEAWYRESHEMDQLVAMSRFAAVMSGRSVVRATNSGISCVIGPDGQDVAILEVEGRRKMVKGTLDARVPVPVRDASGSAPSTPYVRLEGWIQAGFTLLVVLLALLATVGRASAGRAGGLESRSPAGQA